MSKQQTASIIQTRHAKGRMTQSCHPAPKLLLASASRVPSRSSLQSQLTSDETFSPLMLIEESKTCDSSLVSTPESDADFKIRILPLPRPFDPTRTTLGRRSEVEDSGPFIEPVEKRIKLILTSGPSFQEPRLTNAEVKNLEKIYADTLFDNCIETSAERQVDLAAIVSRKFRSYKTQNFADGLSSNSEIFTVLSRFVRQTLPEELGKSVSDSEILNLLRLASSQQVLETLLNSHLATLVQFFSQSRKKGSKRSQRSNCLF